MMEFKYMQFLAGVALFVYAMAQMEYAVKSLAGRSFKIFLRNYSNNYFKLLGSSSIITAFIQSSSIVIAMVLTFVGSGLMNLPAALVAVLGSNLGTTFSNYFIAWIGFKVSLNQLSFPLLAISLFGLLFTSKQSKTNQVIKLIIGIALIFISLDWIKNSLDKSVYLLLGDFSNFHYLIYIPVGFILTAIVQSSTASTIIALTALYNGLINFESAACVMIGSELGTTLKFLLASIQSSTDKKRLAFGNFFMNLITLVVIVIFLQPILYFIKLIFPEENSPESMVFLQVIINVISIVLFFPFVNQLAQFLEKFIKTKNESAISVLNHSKKLMSGTESLQLVESEIHLLLDRTIQLNKIAFKMNDSTGEVWYKNIVSVDKSSYEEIYNSMKKNQGEIVEFLSKIENEDLSESEKHLKSRLITVVRHIMRSSKNLKDVKHNLEELSATGNDIVFKLFNEMKVMQIQFYNDCNSYQAIHAKSDEDKIHELMMENRREYDSSINSLMEALREDKVNEMEVVTLLNVYREVYSANKALVLSIADLNEVDVDE